MRIIAVILLLCCAAPAGLAAQPGAPKVSQSATASGPYSTAYNARNIHIHRERERDPLAVVGSKVAITSAYLVPLMEFAKKRFGEDGEASPNQFYEAALMCVEVANISSQPLLVTAMKLDVINPGKLRFGPGLAGPGCPGEKVSSVAPACLLQPGEKRKWLLQKGMVIPGVVDFLRQQDDEFILDVLPRITNNDAIIDRFNAFLRTKADSKTTLRVSIFELDYKPVLVGHFQLTKGADMFASEPTTQRINGKTMKVYPLQHDAFLGEAISQVREKGDPHWRRSACETREDGQ